MIARLAALAALAALLALGACARKSAPPEAAPDTVATPEGRAADSTRASVPEDLGPPIGRGDAAMNAIAPALGEWVAMWRAAIPGFEVDSLHPGAVGSIRFDGWREGTPARWKDPGDEAIDVLTMRSPDGRWDLCIDIYQSVIESPEGVEIGGEPDSQPVLFDLAGRRELSLAFCGTPCGYHWGRWLDAKRFVLASWSERDYERTRIGGELAVYSLADSSVRSYLTRAVSADEFELYRAEWEKWVGARARKRHVAER